MRLAAVGAADRRANLAGQRGQSIAGYVARLRQGDRLVELAVDGDPQATVRTAFDCSYAVLEPDDRRVFRLLGLVQGPEFTGPAVAALVGMAVGQAERVLDRLAGAHRDGLASTTCYVGTPAIGTRMRMVRLSGRRPPAVSTTDACHTADAADRLVYSEKLRRPVPEAAMGCPIG
jgi:hypothetical protein